VEDFQGCDIALLTARLESEHGFKVERHQLEIFGTCPVCRITTSPATAAA
jgi:Fe2+ or Zn2+ uptake regulation protein